MNINGYQHKDAKDSEVHQQQFKCTHTRSPKSGTASNQLASTVVNSSGVKYSGKANSNKTKKMQERRALGRVVKDR
jgi:hypothetical protein